MRSNLDIWINNFEEYEDDIDNASVIQMLEIAEKHQLSWEVIDAYVGYRKDGFSVLSSSIEALAYFELI